MRLKKPKHDNKKKCDFKINFLNLIDFIFYKYPFNQI